MKLFKLKQDGEDGSGKPRSLGRERLRQGLGCGQSEALDLRCSINGARHCVQRTKTNLRLKESTHLGKLKLQRKPTQLGVDAMCALRPIDSIDILNLRGPRVAMSIDS